MFDNIEKTKLFIHLHALPFPVIGVYDQYYAELLDPYFNISKKVEDFNQLVSEYDSFEDLTKELSLIKTNLPEYINDDLSLAFDCFETNFLSGFNCQSKNSFYEQSNANHYYISIDLVKANLQSSLFITQESDKLFQREGFELNHLFHSANTYEEILEVLEVNPKFSQFKRKRQVLFSKLHPKTQQKTQYLIMEQLVQALHLFNKNFEVMGLNSDELVIRVKKEELETVEKDVLHILKEDKFNSQFDFRVESFFLKQIHPNHSFYVKEFLNGKIEFKCVSKPNLCEVIKYYENRKIQKEDLTFIYEGRLAYFNESIF